MIRSAGGTAQNPSQPKTNNRDWLLATIDLLKPRARSLKDFAGSFRAFFTDEFEADPAAVEKFLKADNVMRLLVELGQSYTQATDSNDAAPEKILRDFTAVKGVTAD